MSDQDQQGLLRHYRVRLDVGTDVDVYATAVEITRAGDLVFLDTKGIHKGFAAGVWRSFVREDED